MREAQNSCGYLSTEAPGTPFRPPGGAARDIGLVASARQASDVLHQVAERLRLVKQVRGVALDQGFLIVGDGAGAGQNQNGRRPVTGVHPQHGEQLEAGLGAEVKVEDDGAERVIVREGHGFGDRARLDGVVPIQAERTGEHPADSRVVVHDQDIAILGGRISRRRIRPAAPVSSPHCMHMGMARARPRSVCSRMSCRARRSPGLYVREVTGRRHFTGGQPV